MGTDQDITMRRQLFRELLESSSSVHLIELDEELNAVSGKFAHMEAAILLILLGNDNGISAVQQAAVDHAKWFEIPTLIFWKVFRDL